MGYDSTNTFPPTTRREDIEEVLSLLGYERLGRPSAWLRDALVVFHWFEERDYRSYSGVGAAIVRAPSQRLAVTTRTPSARSYWDLEHQNRTIRLLRKLLGGTFETDAGKGRYWRNEGDPPAPAESGCHAAFERFGHNLFIVRTYLDSRSINDQFSKLPPSLGFGHYSPTVLSNNLLLPFLVSAVEDYFRSAYTALLRYSPRKLAILRSARLTGDRLAGIAEQPVPIEAVVAETYSFQNLSTVCDLFRALDPRLDLARELHRPYRRRKETLFDTIRLLIADRHALVHRASLNVSLDEAHIERAFDAAEQAVARCNDRIFATYGWAPDPGWTRNLFDVGHRRRLTKNRKLTGRRSDAS